MTAAARWVANEPVDLVRLEEGVTVVGNPQWERAWTEAIRGAYLPPLLWKLLEGGPGRVEHAVRDDNRSALLPEHRVLFEETEYLAAVKGCGANFDAYEPRQLSATRLRELCHDPRLAGLLAGDDGAPSSFLVGERWWGNAPYGGQAGDSALLGLLASLRAEANQIAGFYICPVIAAVRLPDAVARVASQFYWYRRYEGAYWQEIRLMPSNVRLYFHSPVTLGLDSGRVFSLFDLTSFDRCERFLARLIRSTVAAITLYARSLRFDETTGRYSGLDFDEVYLDKDAVLAPDGTLHFADLEGVEAVFAESEAKVRERIEHQFYHNLYEATYAVEAMAQETYRYLGLSASSKDRHRWMLDVFQRACQGDPYVRIERDADRSTVVIEPAVDPDRTGVRLDWTSNGAD